MESKVHFKKVFEKFFINIETEEVYECEYSGSTDLFSDEPIQGILPDPNIIQIVSKPIKRSRIVTKSELTSFSEFKENLKNNKEVGINKETIVVTECDVKNTISIKRYILSKYSNWTKNKKKRILMTAGKKMWSLTINKDTGDFSIFVKTKNKKDFTYFIRKDIITPKIEEHLIDLIESSNLEIKNSLCDALNVFYKQLGYPEEYTAKDFVYHFFKEDKEDKEDDKNFIRYFPMVNYFVKHNIQIDSFYQFYLIKNIFRVNKKKYDNNHINIFIKEYFDIDLEYSDYVLAELKRLKMLSIDNIEFIYVDNFTLKLINQFKIPPNKINKGVNLFLNNPHIYYSNWKPYNVVLDLYDFKDGETVINEIKEAYILSSYFELLYTFYCFGIKINISRLTDLRDIDVIEDLNYIKNKLVVANLKTGSFTISDKFINRLKRYLKKDECIKIDYGRLKLDGDVNFPHFHPIITIQSPSDIINYRIFNTNNEFVSIVYPNDGSSEMYSNVFDNIFNGLYKNRNNIMQTLEMQFLYSREYFEESLNDERYLNLFSYIN